MSLIYKFQIVCTVDQNKIYWSYLLEHKVSFPVMLHVDQDSEAPPTYEKAMENASTSSNVGDYQRTESSI